MRSMTNKAKLIVHHEAELRRMAAYKRRTLAKLRCKACAAEGDVQVAAVLDWMGLLNSQERIGELVPFFTETRLTNEEFWRIFLGIWCICDAAYDWSDELADLFFCHGPCPSHLLPDRKFYDSLPQELTIYRGADRECIDGAISWTTDVNVAERFARGHRFILNPDPVVAVATKNKIYAATNNRNESEVLCIWPDIIDVRASTLQADDWVKNQQ